MSLPAKNTAHLAEARALLIDQFKQRPVIDGLLQAYLGRVQDLEAAIWDVIDKRILDSAVDAQLETLGSLVGEKRLGRGDADYRAAIRIRIRVNRSKGRSVDVLDVASLAAAGARVEYLEHTALQFQVELYAQAGERYVAELLSKTRPAMSLGMLTASDLGRSALQAFDDAVSPIGGIETFSDAVSGGLVTAAAYGLPTDFSQVYLSGAFAPSTLALTAFLIGYAGSPWLGLSSLGTSGSNSASEATNPPAAASGAADFDGLNDLLTGAPLATFLDADGWGVHLRCWIDTLPADPGSGNRYTIGALLSDTGAYFALAPHAGGLTLECADGIGAASNLTVACGTGAWRNVQLRYNYASNGRLQLQVDGAGWTDQVYGQIGSLASALRIGANYNATSFLDGKIKACLISDYPPDDSECANIRAYLGTL